MSVDELSYLPFGSAGSPAPVGPFDRKVGVVENLTMTADNRVKVVCAQHDIRAELHKALRVTTPSDVAWMLYDFELPADFAADPQFTTLGQIHYVENADTPIGPPLYETVVRPDGSLQAWFRCNPHQGQTYKPLLPAVRGKRFYVAIRVQGGGQADVWADYQPFDAMTRVATASQSGGGWGPTTYIYGPQIGLYRGQNEPRTSVAILGTVGWADTFARAAVDAGWSTAAPPPPTPPPGPTNAELRDLAIVHLSNTEISYETWAYRVAHGYKGHPYDPAHTEWGQALAALKLIK